MTHNLHNTPWSQFPARVKTATTEELDSLLSYVNVTGEWREIAQAERDARVTYADALTALLTPLGFTVFEVDYDIDHNLSALLITAATLPGPSVYVTTFSGEIPTSAADAVAALDPERAEGMSGIDGVAVPLHGDVDDHAGLIVAAIRAQDAPRYVGLWQGGSDYSDGYWATDAVAFDSLDHARAFFAARLHNRPTPATRVVDWTEQGYPVAGALDSNLSTPCVGEDATLALAPWSSASLEWLETDEFQARSHTIVRGTRGGIVAVR